MAYIGTSPTNGVRRKHTYTATASQTTFSGAGAEGAVLSYKDSNYVDVYVNGVKLGDADYTATSGTSIVLPSPGAAVNDIVEIIAYDVFSVADTVSKADGGQFDGNVTMAGTLDVTGDLTVDTSTLKVDSTNNRIGIGTVSPATTLDVSGTVQINSGTTNNANTLVVESDNSANIGQVNPQLIIKRNANGATRTGGIYFNALNSASSDVSYSLIETQVTSDTASSETAYLKFQVKGSGSFNNAIRINSDATINFMQSGGGIYLGTTTPNSANLLDTYEEGTWTPDLQDSSGNSGTAATAFGSYVRVGKLVYLSFVLTDINTSGLTISDDIRIYGQPYTAASTSGIQINQGGVFTHTVTFSGNVGLSMADNVNYIRISEVNSGSSFDYVRVTELTSGTSDIYGSITYYSKDT